MAEIPVSKKKTVERDKDTSLAWMSKIALGDCQEKSRKSFLAFLLR